MLNSYREPVPPRFGVFPILILYPASRGICIDNKKNELGWPTNSFKQKSKLFFTKSVLVMFFTTRLKTTVLFSLSFKSNEWQSLLSFSLVSFAIRLKFRLKKVFRSFYTGWVFILLLLSFFWILCRFLQIISKKKLK